MQLCFATCRLDPDSRRLVRDGREAHLTPKAFALLQTLIDSRPRAVAKGELLKRVWPDTFVSEASLARTITELRDAVGDDARAPRVIRTVHAFGYAFAAAVTEVESLLDASSREARYWLLLGSREFCLAEGETLVGRDAGAGVRLQSPRVSRRHARILVEHGSASIEDLGSRNGTFVRGERLTAVARLAHGDEIEIGPYYLTFAVAGGSAATETGPLGTGSTP